MTATQPQIIKRYAQGEIKSMNNLIFSSSKLAFFLVFLFALPIILEADVILRLWLKTVPDQAVLFTRLVIVDLFFSSLYTPIATLSQANGKIGLYQSVVASGFLFTFLITWLLYRLGFPAYSTFVVMVTFSCITLFARLWVVRRLVHFPVKEYCKRVLLKNFRVALLAFPIPVILQFVITNEYLRFGTVVLSSMLLVLTLIWLFGLEPKEKQLVTTKLHTLKENYINRAR